MAERRLFDSSLRRDLGRNFVATLVVLLTIVLTLMLIRTLGLAAGAKLAPQDVVLMLATPRWPMSRRCWRARCSSRWWARSGACTATAK